MRLTSFAAALLSISMAATAVTAQAPPGYYDSANGLTGSALQSALHDIIDDHDVIPFSGGGFDTRDAIDLLQEDPANSNNVVLIYSGFSVPMSTWPDYNREHVWPVSLGTDSGPPNSDMFNIYGCDADVNAQRGNKYFDDCTTGCSTPAEAPQCLFDDDSWEPRDSEKGDIARALFYMDVRYSGDVAGEPDLDLIDGPSSSGCDCMGLLAKLIEWHTLDPPDVAEQERNDTIFDVIQGNRNPFVDQPQFVYDIWGGGPPSANDAWINEIHYDNGGADAEEGVEIAGPAGSSLAGWLLVAYNGANTLSYVTLALGGTIPDEGDGFGALWFPIVGLQNGSPDGIALVDGSSTVLEFLSYEGSFSAGDGPATGFVSTDIGVSEDGSTALGESLQRIGLGSTGADFTWSGPTTHSRGLLNVGQMIDMPPRPDLFIRGDANGDSTFNGLGDPLYILDFQFTGGAQPPCLEAADIDGDGIFNGLSDALYGLQHQFLGGPPPPPPYPFCGEDPDQDSTIGCEIQPGCP